MVNEAPTRSTSPAASSTCTSAQAPGRAPGRDGASAWDFSRSPASVSGGRKVIGAGRAADGFFRSRPSAATHGGVGLHPDAAEAHRSGLGRGAPLTSGGRRQASGSPVGIGRHGAVDAVRWKTPVTASRKPRLMRRPRVDRARRAPKAPLTARSPCRCPCTPQVPDVQALARLSCRRCCGEVERVGAFVDHDGVGLA